MKGTSDAASAGSRVLVDSPPCMPTRSTPPFTGSCARLAVAKTVEASAADTPIAAAMPLNSRRLRFLRAANMAKVLRSFDIFFSL